ncbi:MAG: ribonuclease, partial [Rhodospirillales bacterium]|nr:ribonuclease [Rhodospirillales bacterium]
MPRFGPPPKGHRARARPAPLPTAAGIPGELPTLDALRVFLSKAKGKVGKSDISRAFRLTTEQRPALRKLLSELKTTTPAAVAHAIIPHGHLPDMAVVEV